MKRQFWFIGLFGVWCLLSAMWYFFTVKGVNTNPEGFKPQVALVAIIEILVMLLIACLLGYGAAWWGRGDAVDIQHDKIEALERESRSLVAAHDESKRQTEAWREKHRQDLQAAQQAHADLLAEREKLVKAKIELESVVSEIRHERSNLRANLKQEEGELESLRSRIRQLEGELKDSAAAITGQKQEIELLKAKKEHSIVSDHPFVRPHESGEKDDLTKIKGIGPFIEKRLNMIGIYTYAHLSELSPEMVDRVGAAIEFFPHRIIKDDWVGQARKYANA